MVYTVTLNPSIDYVVWAEKFQTGILNRAQRELIQIGGKGINVSVMLGRLGVATTALGFVAGFTGREIERQLDAEGVRTDFVHLSEGFSRINVKLKGECETELNGRGPAIDEQAVEALCKKLEKLGREDFLVLAGSVTAGVSPRFYADLLERFSESGARFVVDAEGELLTRILKYHPFLIKPNQVELGEIFQKKLLREEEIQVCAAQLQKQGARNVLISLGAEGAMLLDETGHFHRVAAPCGTVINSVGAGDSMVAGFLASWLVTNDFSAALRMGAAAGSATAFSDGLAKKQDVMDLLEKL